MNVSFDATDRYVARNIVMDYAAFTAANVPVHLFGMSSVQPVQVYTPSTFEPLAPRYHYISYLIVPRHYPAL